MEPMEKISKKVIKKVIQNLICFRGHVTFLPTSNQLFYCTVNALIRISIFRCSKKASLNSQFPTIVYYKTCYFPADVRRVKVSPWRINYSLLPRHLKPDARQDRLFHLFYFRCNWRHITRFRYVTLYTKHNICSRIITRLFGSQLNTKSQSYISRFYCLPALPE